MVKFINVRCLMQYDGKVIPLEIEWEDGRKFVIDRITDIKRAASTKGGGKGIRYTCYILGKQKYLFLNEYTWFIELN